MREYDLIIIGAGLSGLSLGALLAEEGTYKTLICEASNKIGGRVRVEERGGYLVDYGIHALLLAENSSIIHLLRKMGIKVGVDKVGMCIFKNKIKNFIPSSLFAIHQIGRLGLSSNIKLLRQILQVPIKGASSYYQKSVEEWLKDIQAKEDICDILKGICIGLLATTSWEMASFGEILQFLKLVLQNKRIIGYPRGGWNSLLLPLFDKIRNSPKVKIEFRKKVVKINLKDNKVVGVKTKEEDIKAPIVVCAFPPQDLIRKEMFAKNLISSDYQEKIKNLRPTAGVSIDLGLKKVISKERRVIINLDEPSLAWFVSNVCKEVAPPGKQLLTIFSPQKYEDLSDPSYLRSRAKTLFEYYNNLFPLTSNLEWKREIPMLVNSAELNIYQTRDKRPTVRVPDIEGLYLIGDGVAVEGVGGEMAVRSAQICYQYLIQSSL